MVKKRTHMNLEEYKEFVREQLDRLEPVFVHAALGDYSLDVPIDSEESEFTGLQMGIQIMMEVIREKFEMLEEMNQQLESRVANRTQALREAQSIAKIGSWEYEVHSRKLTCSHEVYKVLDLDPSKPMRPGHLLKLMSNKDATKMVQLFQYCYDRREPIDIQFEVSLADGNRFFELKARPKDDYIIDGTLQDITKHKLHEQELQKVNHDLEDRVLRRTDDLRSTLVMLRESQERLRSFMNAARDIFLVFDRDFKLLDLNRSAKKLFQAPRKHDIVGKKAKDFFPVLDRKNYREILNAVLETGEPKRIDVQLRDMADDPIHFTLDIFRVDDGIGMIARDITVERLHEQALKRSNERYKMMLETMNEGVVILDTEDKIRFVNQKFCEETGYGVTELIGEPSLKSLIRQRSQELNRELVSMPLNGVNTECEFKLKCADGREKWMRVNSAPTFDIDGNPNGIIRLHTNISDRKWMEQNLDDIAKFTAQNPNPVLRYSIGKSKLIYFNHAAREVLTFFRPNPIIRAEWVEFVQSAFKKDDVRQKELRTEDKAFLFTVVPVQEAGYVNLYGTEITEAKAAMDEVERLLLTLGQMDSAVLIADRNGKIQWVNMAFENSSECALSELKGWDCTSDNSRKLIRPGHDPQLYRKVLETKKHISFETRIGTGRSANWVYTTISPVLDTVGDLKGIVAIDVDITEKKTAERAMIKAKNLAEESSKSKEQFLANMSHEIRTPMNAIMGIVQLLQETPLNDQQRQYLKSIDFAGHNLLYIIDDVLDLSKIESGKLRFEKVAFNIQELLENLLNSMLPKAKEKQIYLEVHAEDGMPQELLGDPVRLNQILINLVSNALKFTEEGGVRLTANTLRKDKGSCEIRFSIKDTGIGVSKAKQKLIFQEFEQASNETTRKFGGTGLGLAIVKRLTKLMSGRLSLKSNTGKGSEFIVQLPFEYRDKPNEIVRLEDESRDEFVLHNRKALLVEDNRLNQMVAREFLQSFGLEVVLAENGLIAVETLKKDSFDLILMDIQMPELDGYDSTRKIRKELKLDVPIIAMTAHAINGEREKCLMAGMNEYITKPLDKKLLSKTLIQTLKK